MDSRGYDIAVCAGDEELLHHMVQTYVEATASEVRTDRGVMNDSFAAAGSTRLMALSLHSRPWALKNDGDLTSSLCEAPTLPFTCWQTALQVSFLSCVCVCV
jgi:hypothetical protein